MGRKRKPWEHRHIAFIRYTAMYYLKMGLRSDFYESAPGREGEESEMAVIAFNLGKSLRRLGDTNILVPDPPPAVSQALAVIEEWLEEGDYGA